MTTMRERITEDGITASATWRDSPPAHIDADEWGRGASWYDVKLRMGRRTMTVPFGMGPAHTSEPTAAEVLDCLASDASSYENSRGFEDWAGDFGFDTDSRKAERIYRAVERQSAKLRAFLGGRYEAYLWETERL